MYVFGGVIFGTVITSACYHLGAGLFKRAYLDITAPYYIEELQQHQDSNNPNRGLSKGDEEAYDWSEYDNYIHRAEEDDEEFLKHEHQQIKRGD